MTHQEENKPLVTGVHVYLRKLHRMDKSQKYLDWLNNPELQKYSRFHAQRVSVDDLDNFLQLVKFTRDWHLAIIVIEGNNHIGNIALNSLDEDNRKAHVSIMMGELAGWDKGYAAEAVQLISQFAFEQLGLHRLWAETPHPRFNELLQKLGWVHESVAREAFRSDESYLDHARWALLEHEWRDLVSKGT